MEELEKKCDLSCIFVYIDMDVFYVVVEILDNFELCDKFMVVGGNLMLFMLNYLVRCYGVRVVMLGFIVKKLCFEFIIVLLYYEIYKEYSC